MRILIADDLQSKIQKLIAVLVGSYHVQRAQIEVAHNANDARRFLQATFFDLFIMDIVLPRRSEDVPARESSLELLQEIVEDEAGIKPGHILGLTAYPEEALAAEPFFKSHLWSVLKFDETSNDWAQPIGNCIEYIRGQRKGTASTQYETDLCILTALQEPEMTAIHRLPWAWKAWEPIDDVTFVKRGEISVGGATFSVVSAVAARMGMISTTVLSSKLISRFKPRVIAMAGICAGVKDKTSLGDVIFADTSWDWQSGKRVRDKENSQFAMDPHHLTTDEYLRSRAKQLKAERGLWNDVRLAWPDAPEHELRFHVGPLASGSAVLADGRTVEEIRSQQRTLLGVEMEAYGLFAAAAGADRPIPRVMAMKSVCDFADPDKKDAMQAYAAFTSATALRTYIERFLPDIVKSSP
jgi:nucleoside phosphorylase/CheY-like chemotaxis protein